MNWLLSPLRWLIPSPPVPPDDSESVTRRRHDLERRLERLTREVEVIQRVQGNEGPRQ
jgi:tetrahydromethanopterin S-methyltransferase subunit G